MMICAHVTDLSRDKQSHWFDINYDLLTALKISS